MSTNNGLPLFIDMYYFVHANQKIMHNKLLSCGIQLQIKMTHNKLVEQSTRRKIYCLYLIFKLILAFELLALNQDFTFWNRLDICPVELNNIYQVHSLDGLWNIIFDVMIYRCWLFKGISKYTFMNIHFLENNGPVKS